MPSGIKKEIQLEIGHVLFIDIVGYSKRSINEQRVLLDSLNQIVRSTEEFLRSVPNTLREGALALGATKWKAVATVVIPAALPGITTVILLALARVAGETAPLLFTAFGNLFWSPGWNQPTASLPDTIFKYAIAPYEDWHRQAWAAGLVLLTLVLATNIAARFILRRQTSQN